MAYQALNRTFSHSLRIAAFGAALGLTLPTAAQTPQPAPKPG